MTLDQAITDAKKTFRNFPPELFTLWLDDRIKQNGWPHSGVEWRGFLCGESISFWQNLIWVKTLIIIHPIDLSEASFNSVKQIIGAANGEQNLISKYIPNTVERYVSSIKYLQSTGRLPGSPILLRRNNLLDIIDGNHRLAALLAVQNSLDDENTTVSFTAWVGDSSNLEHR